MACATLLLSCSRPDTRPSILLFVFDTTRADAVSAYGGVRNTTPELDALAASGLRYDRAYANAPWTLPSHVTLFTGLLPHQHGVGSQTMQVPDSVVMLAERLRAAGYDTAGFSENPFVGPTFNMTQGFEHFANKRDQAGAGIRQIPAEHDVQTFVADWLQKRSGRRPFFLFVNVMDAHELYPIAAENPFVPEGVDAEMLRSLDRHVNERICTALPPPTEIDILRGLYLGGVAAADTKLRAVREQLRGAGLMDRLITLVTADHGEHFGEHRLMEHNFSVRDPLLHVPLVVSGLQGVPPAIIDAPVQLADVAPTLLRSVGAEVPDGMAGGPLPTQPSAAPVHDSLIAEYTEPDDVVDSGDEPDWLKDARGQITIIRARCTAADRVFGNMVAFVRYPFKLIWFERYPMQLYDLSKDPSEQSDLAAARPDVVATFQSDLDAMHERAGARIAPAPRATLPSDVQEQLRVLGYLGGSGAGKTTPRGKSP